MQIDLEQVAKSALREIDINMKEIETWKWGMELLRSRCPIVSWTPAEQRWSSGDRTGNVASEPETGNNASDPYVNGKRLPNPRLDLIIARAERFVRLQTNLKLQIRSMVMILA
jgi:hypothetical protein